MIALRSGFTATLVLAVAAGSLHAQLPRSEDVSTIDGVIAAYYDVISGPAGEAPDVARDQSLHHPEAWVAIANTSADGSKTVNVMTLAEYHGDGGPRAQPFYEWETERRIQRSGDMVHVWSHYASSREPDGEVFDTGVNSITLLHDGDRWWVMGWMFDQTAN
ncbi:MAG: nuclear transport factor 2 family protein [Gemmatimonadota bacterium]